MNPLVHFSVSFLARAAPFGVRTVPAGVGAAFNLGLRTGNKGESDLRCLPGGQRGSAMGRALALSTPNPLFNPRCPYVIPPSPTSTDP